MGDEPLRVVTRAGHMGEHRQLGAGCSELREWFDECPGRVGMHRPAQWHVEDQHPRSAVARFAADRLRSLLGIVHRVRMRRAQLGVAEIEADVPAHRFTRRDFPRPTGRPI